jgi:hypothetical protein
MITLGTTIVIYQGRWKSEKEDFRRLSGTSGTLVLGKTAVL